MKIGNPLRQPGATDHSSEELASAEVAAINDARAETAQRLQIGLSGLGAMILLVGLASVIGSQADASRESAVPEAAPTTEPTEAPPQRDPLVDAGIVPDIPAEPSPIPEDLPADLDPPTVEDARPSDDVPTEP